MRKIVLAAIIGCALTARAADPAPQQPTLPPGICLPGRDCTAQTILPKDRRIDTGKKQCGWTVVNGNKEPRFDCGGAK